MLKRACLVLLAPVLAFLGTPRPLRAQQPQIHPDAYSQLEFRYIGPVGNRTTAVAGVPGSPYLYYVGTASGGIFKTTDGGTHWDPIFDAEPVSSIGSLAVAASDPNIVWAGTGESYIRSHISVGDGIYKSTDAGKTWTHMGLDKTGRIGNVLIDPRNPDIVLACALGHGYGPQPERGVFRTTDGGKNWEKTLFVDENTGCSDVGMDPNNSRTLFAGMWQMEIHTWGRSSGGPGSGLFKSTDGGATWKRLEGHGLPHSPVGRIAVRVAQRDSNRVYAMIETGDGVPWEGHPGQSGALWRSDDGGENWQLVNSDRQVRGRTHYYTREEISPDNENEVYFFTSAFSRTLDGGHTLTNMPASPGGDNHEMWIDPTNGDRMAVVNDQGVSISVNRGHSWDHIQLPIAQIYHVTVDDQIPYYVYGNRQDGSSYRGPSNSLQFGGFGGGGISRSHWHPIAGGESGFAIPDPVDNNIIWSSGTGAGSVSGAVVRFDERNRQWREVEVWPVDVSGATAAEVKYRFNWEFPIAISPHDHNTVYAGSQFVHETTDGGNSWHVISPDLTRNDKSRMGSSGGLTPDNIGVEYAGVVFAIAESPKEAGVIWAGTNDGLVQITRDAGKNWTNVTKNIPNMLDWGTVSNIEASRYDAGTEYFTGRWPSRGTRSWSGAHVQARRRGVRVHHGTGRLAERTDEVAARSRWPRPRRVRLVGVGVGIGVGRRGLRHRIGARRGLRLHERGDRLALVAQGQAPQSGRRHERGLLRTVGGGLGRHHRHRRARRHLDDGDRLHLHEERGQLAGNAHDHPRRPRRRLQRGRGQLRVLGGRLGNDRRRGLARQQRRESPVGLFLRDGDRGLAVDAHERAHRSGREHHRRVRLVRGHLGGGHRGGRLQHPAARRGVHRGALTLPGRRGTARTRAPSASDGEQLVAASLDASPPRAVLVVDPLTGADAVAPRVEPRRLAASHCGGVDGIGRPYCGGYPDPGPTWAAPRQDLLVDDVVTYRRGLPGRARGADSEGSDPLGLETLGPLLRVEIHLLPFDQLAISRTLDRREVREDVRAAVVGRDEPEALGGVEPFHRTCGHRICLSSPRS